MLGTKSVVKKNYDHTMTSAAKLKSTKFEMS